MTTRLAALLPILLAAACASTGTPTVDVPSNLRPAAYEKLTAVVPAKGVQIYECRVEKDRFQWTFVAPEAELFDAWGFRVGKHYAGPHWESNDGSRIIGKVKERADAPRVDAIPWLLLTTTSDGGAGAFERVTSVQRVNTVGGVAPKEGCSQAMLGATERVSYTADYYFFAAK